jgi:hypothetical protein
MSVRGTLAGGACCRQSVTHLRPPLGAVRRSLAEYATFTRCGLQWLEVSGTEARQTGAGEPLPRFPHMRLKLRKVGVLLLRRVGALLDVGEVHHAFGLQLAR